MKNKIMVFLIAIASVFFFTACDSPVVYTAEDGQTIELNEEDVKAAAGELGLTTDQIIGLKEFWETETAAHQTAMEDFRTQMESILTDEQKAVLAELKENRPEQSEDRTRRSGDRTRRPEGMPEVDGMKRALGALDLTEEQKETIKGYYEEIKAALEAAKEAGEDPRKTAKSLFDEVKTKIEALLTDEQIAKLAEMKENRPARDGDKPRLPKLPFDKLDLTEDQITELKALYEEAKTEFKTFMEEAKTRFEAKIEELGLSEEQVKGIKRYLAEKMGKNGPGPGGPGMDKPRRGGDRGGRR